MPSKTFFHLPAEKRERLLLAAEEEFARVPYAEAVSYTHLDVYKRQPWA